MARDFLIWSDALLLNWILAVDIARERTLSIPIVAARVIDYRVEILGALRQPRDDRRAQWHQLPTAAIQEATAAFAFCRRRPGQGPRRRSDFVYQTKYRLEKGGGYFL